MEQHLREPPAAPRFAAEDRTCIPALICALVIAAAFAGLLLGTIDFALGTHADEPSKAAAVLYHFNNYNHPLLVLHLARGANALAGLTGPQEILELGRALAVIAGALAIVVTYLLARAVLPAARPAFAAPFIAPPAQRRPLLVIAAFAAMWIGAHELSPLKPYPNFHRYMVPAAPLLVILGTALIYQLAERRLPRWSGAIAATAILLAGLPALYASYRIAGPPEEDLRAIVPPILLADTPDAAFDSYTRFRVGDQYAPHGRHAPARTNLLVTSSLVYGRYGEPAASPLQPHGIRARAALYADLFRRPYLELSNGRPAFAFFNSGVQDRRAGRRHGASRAPGGFTARRTSGFDPQPGQRRLGWSYRRGG